MNMIFKKEPVYIKFTSYQDWLRKSVSTGTQQPSSSTQQRSVSTPEKLQEHKEKYARGVRAVMQVALAHGVDYKPLSFEEVTNNAEKTFGKITYVNLKIKGFKKIGLWGGANYKDEEGVFIFNIDWLNDFVDNNLDTDSARFKLRAYMMFDCKSVDENEVPF